MPAQRVVSIVPDTRRAAMYRTAAQMFRDRGFDATSVSDIARALGLTKAGLYHHFESKEALLFEIMMFGLDKVRDEVMTLLLAGHETTATALAWDGPSLVAMRLIGGMAGAATFEATCRTVYAERRRMRPTSS